MLSSTLFYLWFHATTNCRTIADPDVELFPTGDIRREEYEPLEGLFVQLMDNLKQNARRRVYDYSTKTGRVEYDEYYPSLAKSIIDEIDATIGRALGLDEEELEFLRTYQCKYRLGRDQLLPT